jgi:hypothetical protein
VIVHPDAAVSVTAAVADGSAVVAVLWHPPGDTGLSGFLALADADPDDDGADTGVMHLSCLFDTVPDLGRALVVPRRHGAAILDGGQWMPDDTAVVAP